MINKPGADNPWNGFYKPPGADNPWNGFYKPPGSENVVVQDPSHPAAQTTTVTTHEIGKAGLDNPWNGFYKPPGSSNVVVQDPTHPGQTTVVTQDINQPIQTSHIDPKKSKWDPFAPLPAPLKSNIGGSTISPQHAQTVVTTQ